MTALSALGLAVCDDGAVPLPPLAEGRGQGWGAEATASPVADRHLRHPLPHFRRFLPAAPAAKVRAERGCGQNAAGTDPRTHFPCALTP